MRFPGEPPPANFRKGPITAFPTPPGREPPPARAVKREGEIPAHFRLIVPFRYQKPADWLLASRARHRLSLPFLEAPQHGRAGRRHLTSSGIVTCFCSGRHFRNAPQAGDNLVQRQIHHHWSWRDSSGRMRPGRRGAIRRKEIFTAPLGNSCRIWLVGTVTKHCLEFGQRKRANWAAGAKCFSMTTREPPWI